MMLTLTSLSSADRDFVALLRDHAIQDGAIVRVSLAPCPEIPVWSRLTLRERALRFGVNGLEPRHQADPLRPGVPTTAYLDAVERMYGEIDSCPAYVVRYTAGWQSLPDDLAKLQAIRKEFEAWCHVGEFEPVPVDQLREALADRLCDALFGSRPRT